MTVSMPASPIHHTPIEAKLPVVKVVGLGGGGQNAIDRMIELGLEGLDFIAVNTDSQALASSLAPVKIQLGPKLTRGLGAGGNPETGEAAAEESYREINQALTGADMVFLTAGMGGGTGTGAISIFARVAKSLGAVVIALVTMPFAFEMSRRSKNAQSGLQKLQPYADTLISIPNDRLLQVAPLDLPIEMAFRLADDILRQGIQGVSELITQPGLINVDFSHIKNLMKNGGGSLLAIGTGQGDNQAIQAVEHALHHPMLEAINLENASGIIANFTGGNDLSFGEVTDALVYLQQKTGGKVDIIPGVVNDSRMLDRTQVTLVITGLAGEAMDASLVSQAVHRTVETSADCPQQVNPAEVFETGAAEPVSLPQFEMAGTHSDLDLPSFMRRRTG